MLKEVVKMKVHRIWKTFELKTVDSQKHRLWY